MELKKLEMEEEDGQTLHSVFCLLFQKIRTINTNTFQNYNYPFLKGTSSYIYKINPKLTK